MRLIIGNRATGNIRQLLHANLVLYSPPRGRNQAKLAGAQGSRVGGEF